MIIIILVLVLFIQVVTEQSIRNEVVTEEEKKFKLFSKLGELTNLSSPFT
jgi:hypothetical protein